MKIATWNLERLIKRKTKLVLDKLVDINADILILTETNSIIQLENYTCISTSHLPTNFDNIKYEVGENRVSILTKYNATIRHKTFDSLHDCLH
jgi:exonuclease III